MSSARAGMKEVAVLVMLVVGIVARTDAADSLNCRLVGSYTLGSPHAVALSGNVAYVVGAVGLYILDVSDPVYPCELGHIDTARHGCDVAVFGDLAYVADDDAGLFIIDVSDPEMPYVAGWCDTPGWPSGVALSRDYAYVADDLCGLRIIDVSDPQAPYEVGHWDGLGKTRGVALSGNLAYVTDYDSGLQIVDVSDPQAPYEVGCCSLLGNTLSVAVSGNFAYVGGGDLFGKLRVIDVSNPQKPHEVGWVGFRDLGAAVAVSGNFAYVVDWEGLYVVDVSNPQSPHLAGWYEGLEAANDVAVSGNLAYTPGLDIFEFLGEGVEESERPEPRRPALEMSPNPARRMAQVSCPEAVTAVRVYDALGRLVKSLKPQEGRATLSGISAGLYLLKAEAAGHTLSAKLVMR